MSRPQRRKRARRIALIEVCLMGDGCCGLPSVADIAAAHPYDFSQPDMLGSGSGRATESRTAPRRRDRFERRT